MGHHYISWLRVEHTFGLVRICKFCLEEKYIFDVVQTCKMFLGQQYTFLFGRSYIVVLGRSHIFLLGHPCILDEVLVGTFVLGLIRILACGR